MYTYTLMATEMRLNSSHCCSITTANLKKHSFQLMYNVERVCVLLMQIQIVHPAHSHRHSF